jgi:hypothetical protein
MSYKSRRPISTASLMENLSLMAESYHVIQAVEIVNAYCGSPVYCVVYSSPQLALLICTATSAV